MIEQDWTDLLNQIDRFVAGDTSKTLADDLLGLVLECFRDEDWADEVVWVLSCYEPGGGAHYYDERAVAAELSALAATVRAGRSDECG
jgi:hypothetical protein